MFLQLLTDRGPVQMKLSLAGANMTIEQGPPGGPLAVSETLTHGSAEEAQAALDAKLTELRKGGAVLPKTGASLAKVPACVKSSWVASLFAIDDDAFVVAGYDDPKIARWSVKKRAPEQEATIDRRHEDNRYSRVYGMTMAAKSRRLYTSAWNETVDVMDPRSFEIQMTYDVAYSFEHLAVDDEERWLLLATSTVLDLLDLRTGARVARQTTSAPISSVLITGPGHALLGLASGELLTATWPT